MTDTETLAEKVGADGRKTYQHRSQSLFKAVDTDGSGEVWGHTARGMGPLARTAAQHSAAGSAGVAGSELSLCSCCVTRATLWLCVPTLCCCASCACASSVSASSLSVHALSLLCKSRDYTHILSHFPA